jgi:hypothetical protein
MSEVASPSPTSSVADLEHGADGRPIIGQNGCAKAKLHSNVTLRDTRKVLSPEDEQAYRVREIPLCATDGGIDRDRSRARREILFNRQLHVFESAGPLDVSDVESKQVTNHTLAMIAGSTE